MSAFESSLQTLFSMLYVMTETVPAGKAPPYYHTSLLYTVDVLQVLRVLLQPIYGWNETTYNVMKFFDPVFVFSWLVSSVVPRYTLFILAFLLVGTALADTCVVVMLFRAGEVTQLAPIKLLRSLVGLVVVLLFSSVIKWCVCLCVCIYVCVCVCARARLWSKIARESESKRVCGCVLGV